MPDDLTGDAQHFIRPRDFVRWQGPKKAHELLDSAARWTRGALARDAEGVSVSPFSSIAVSWSLIGALQRCHQEQWNVARDKAWGDVIARFGAATNLGVYNDEIASYEDVVAFLRRLDL